MRGARVIRDLLVTQYGQPVVDFVERLGDASIGSERTRIDLGFEVHLLCLNLDLFVQFLGDLNEPTAVHLAVPLQFAQLAAQLEQGRQQVLHVVVIQALYIILHGMAVSVLQQFQPAGEIRGLFVVEVVDIFEVSIQGVEKS